MQQTPAPSERASPLVVLGGVFDPVHNGHLQLAERVEPGLALLTGEKSAMVRFLPAGEPPHKTSRGAADRWHRLEMLKLAVESGRSASGHFGPDTRVEIDDRELYREGISFSVLSFRELRAENPDRKLYFLMGSDNLVHLGGWYCAQELLELCTPLIVPRPGARAVIEPHHLPWMGEDALRDLNRLVLPGPLLEISSSEIRRRISSNASIDGLVPAQVARYIEDHRLYGD